MAQQGARPLGFSCLGSVQVNRSLFSPVRVRVLVRSIARAHFSLAADSVLLCTVLCECLFRQLCVVGMHHSCDSDFILVTPFALTAAVVGMCRADWSIAPRWAEEYGEHSEENNMAPNSSSGSRPALVMSRGWKYEYRLTPEGRTYGTLFHLTFVPAAVTYEYLSHSPRWQKLADAQLESVSGNCSLVA